MNWYGHPENDAQKVARERHKAVDLADKAAREAKYPSLEGPEAYQQKTTGMVRR